MASVLGFGRFLRSWWIDTVCLGYAILLLAACGCSGPQYHGLPLYSGCNRDDQCSPYRCLNDPFGDLPHVCSTECSKASDCPVCDREPGIKPYCSVADAGDSDAAPVGVCNVIHQW